MAISVPASLHESAAAPSSLRTPGTWGELLAMRDSLSRHFGDVRLAALADREKGSEVGTLDVAVAQAAWSMRPEQQETDPLPPEVRRACDDLLAALGVKAAPTLGERVSAGANAVKDWIRRHAAAVLSY